MITSDVYEGRVLTFTIYRYVHPTFTTNNGNHNYEL
ncbi:hypothetical protein PMEL_200719 [Prevotella melaninogenica]|uniref:Uncharacterized protein n=1 Tax=Prevotella melaninogenica TaxID=28132 RepID=A0A250KKJ7_9BACT|nr:hypothetical protein PMEL_200719 [Prevotella melaninogenica]